MKRNIRVGIVGCGGIARAHLAAYRKCRGVEIASVYDQRKSAAKAFAEEAGARVARSVDEMATRDGLAAVSICTPPSAHLENCKPFLAAKVPILCEKPLAASAAPAAKLAAAARRSRSVFMMGFCHRFHPAIIELKKLIKRGLLGRPILFRNIFGGYVPLKGNHRARPDLSGGGCLIDHCSHSIDLFRFLVGEPTHVQARGGNVVQKLPVEDFGMIHLERDGNTFGDITSSYSLKVCGNWVEWYGTKGTAVVSYWNEGHPDLAFRVQGGSWTPVDCSRHPDRFTGQIRHFLACVRSRRKPSVSAEDGLKANHIVAAVYRSAARGKLISLARLV